jgi:hypothetical protein
MSVAPGAVGSPEWFGQMASGSVNQLGGYIGSALPVLFTLFMGVLGLYAVIGLARAFLKGGG